MIALARKQNISKESKLLPKLERQQKLAKVLQESIEKAGGEVEDFTWFSNKEIRK